MTTTANLREVSRMIVDDDCVSAIQDDTLEINLSEVWFDDVLDDNENLEALRAEVAQQLREKAEQAAWAAALEVATALNLYGNETAEELMEKPAQLEDYMTPECDHESEEECEADDCSCSFPAWFVEQAEPAADSFRDAIERRRTIDRVEIVFVRQEAV